jgi:outer membrane protein assembly factor BamB
MRAFPIALALAILILGCSEDPQDCGSWLQWGGNAAHQGAACTSGQPVARILADVVHDPFVDLEKQDGEGDLFVHYQAPLLTGDSVYMGFKAGGYTSCLPATEPDQPPDCSARYRFDSQVWIEKRFDWDGDQLAETWSFATDWKPPPVFQWEPLFQPAISGGLIYLPGAGGTVHAVDRDTGLEARWIRPFGAAIDPRRYVAGPISTDVAGDIYYTVIQLDHDDPWNRDATGWLVKVAPSGAASIRATADMAVDGAFPTACYGTFNPRTLPLPWPPVANPDGSPALPPLLPCGSQRPAINAAPAVGPGGTVFVVTRAHFASRYSYLVALSPSLEPLWAASLRDLLQDGCGVLVREDGDASDPDRLSHCRPGAASGVDPATNLMPAGQAIDISSSSPVALPDGGVAYGAYTGYNGARGHLMKLDGQGHFLGAYDFGWDETPAVARNFLRGGTDYSIVLKDNVYVAPDATNGADTGPFFITRLDHDLRPVWKFRNTETRACERLPDGSLSCRDDHPTGFEWCINAPVVDKDGVVYANSEDGNLYAIGPDGKELGRIFLSQSVGAAYTPLALDRAGRIYTLNNGHMIVVGR